MDIKIRSKLWIEIDGLPVFGRGRGLLLEAIDKRGSINQASNRKIFSTERSGDT
jgi:molybdenum-dependent DNA-binding transcriptional regulator ModE